MSRFNIHEAKTRLSEILAELGPGEAVIICRRNTPVAELRALPRVSGKRRPFGLEAGRLVVPPAFFDPLPDDLIEAFEATSR